MKALVYCGPKQIEVHDVPAPQPAEGKVKLKIRYCGICGSDTGIYLGTHPRAKAPLIFGHEFIGTLEEDGKKFKKGDRVAAYPLISCGKCYACRNGQYNACKTLNLIGIDCDGGLCEEQYVDEDVLYKLPEGVSDEAAATVEPLAVIIRAMHQAEFKTRDVAVVIGAGPIGMIMATVLKHNGASKVFISDIMEKRLVVADKLGLRAVNPSKESLYDLVMEATDGEGCDCLFECSASAPAAMEMTDLVRVGGMICMVSVHKKPHEVNLHDINFKEQRMIGTRVYTRDEFAQALAYTSIIQEDLEKIVTHIVPLSESGNVFDMIADPELGTIKILVDCQK